MLERHIAFLAHVSKPAARAKKKEILDAIRSLRQMPQRFPFLEDPCFPQDVYHKLFVKNWYLILYRIASHTVLVEYILDCRKDYTWLIK